MTWAQFYWPKIHICKKTVTPFENFLRQNITFWYGWLVPNDVTSFFTNMYCRSVKLFKSHFLLTAKKKCLLLCNLPYVVIYLIILRKIAQKYILVFSSYQKMTQVQFSCAKTHFSINYVFSKDGISFCLVFSFMYWRASTERWAVKERSNVVPAALGLGLRSIE